MKLTKKLSQLGDAAYGLVLTQELLALLGIESEDGDVDATTEVDVTLTVYGDTLIVRRADAPPPTPAEVAYFLTEDLSVAKHFSTYAVTPEVDERHFDIEALIKPGVNLRLTPMIRYSLGLFKQFGELREILVQNDIDPAMLSNVQEIAQRSQLRELLKYSLIVVASVPLLIVYPFVQRHFVKGVMIGSVKG